MSAELTFTVCDAAAGEGLPLADGSGDALAPPEAEPPQAASPRTSSSAAKMRIPTGAVRFTIHLRLTWIRRDPTGSTRPPRIHRPHANAFLTWSPNRQPRLRT